ncbi:hypothetical protein RFI_22888 [Reticulomyxa filosa]|uniref:beta-N-acetylhexosaminidase n=1 Tax=Reticulomyxa filosa TaxID=46433 RepID=X6MKE4_RETFI|nr:hypothetical protein RFI_22888 [Reticulomyxa filosa]|eukprot:ETO14478.1 hypothetical protein RFI_22888 [Reticulomyxa filosa]
MRLKITNLETTTTTTTTIITAKSVFHWHVVDEEAFPYQSRVNSELWKGAYSANERYSESDILDIIEYARIRGIRVIPEFDTPGHAGSWCVGYPQLCINVSCPKPSVLLFFSFTLFFHSLQFPSYLFVVVVVIIDSMIFDFCFITPATFYCLLPYQPHLLDPSKELTWNIIDDELLHLGADEVTYECYENDKHVRQWMQHNNVRVGKDVYKYFVFKARELSIKHGRRPVVWNEVYDNFHHSLRLDCVCVTTFNVLLLFVVVVVHVHIYIYAYMHTSKDTVIHFWQPHKKQNIPTIVSEGFDVILSHIWYLDWTWTNWKEMYLLDPITGNNVQDKDAHHVLGGEGTHLFILKQLLTNCAF